MGIWSLVTCRRKKIPMAELRRGVNNLLHKYAYPLLDESDSNDLQRMAVRLEQIAELPPSTFGPRKRIALAVMMIYEKNGNHSILPSQYAKLRERTLRG